MLFLYVLKTCFNYYIQTKWENKQETGRIETSKEPIYVFKWLEFHQCKNLPDLRYLTSFLKINLWNRHHTKKTMPIYSISFFCIHDPQ